MAILGLILLFAGIFMVAVAIDAWVIMVVVGIMHNDWWNVIPPMGFGTAVAISFVVSIPLFILGALKSS